MTINKKTILFLLLIILSMNTKFIFLQVLNQEMFLKCTILLKVKECFQLVMTAKNSVSL